MHAVLAQISPTPGDWKVNAARVTEVLAAYPDADVAVFPELFLSGYDSRHAVRLASEATGPELACVARAAEDAATAVVVGFPERLGSGAIANALACIDRTGEIVGVYRKTHLFGDESRAFKAGDSLLVVELFGSRVAPLICFDIEFPEPARGCALAGAEVLITASANMEPYYADQRIAAQARALENRLPHLYVNRCGAEGRLRFVGGTCLIGTNGAIIAAAAGSDEEVLYVEVPSGTVPDERIDYLRHRRGKLPVARAPMTSPQTPESFEAPRFTGVRTFGHCPLATDLEGVDVAVLGVPFDTGVTNRPGTRFGPEAVRAASIALRPYNAEQGVQVFGRLSVADLGDVETTPGNAERTMEQIAVRLESIVSAGTHTLCLGGDHTIVLGELRAHAAVHGPLGLVLLDAHADVWDLYVGQAYHHGSPFRRALEEGLLDPSRSLLAGMRGPLDEPEDAHMPEELGFEVIPCEELVSLTSAEYSDRVRRRIGDGPLFLSFDIDVLDPAFAPGTGAPETGGLSTREALSFVRALRGLRFSGYDVVEVSPPYDSPGQPTAVAASNIAYELLTLDVLGREVAT